MNCHGPLVGVGVPMRLVRSRWRGAQGLRKDYPQNDRESIRAVPASSERWPVAGGTGDGSKILD